MMVTAAVGLPKYIRPAAVRPTFLSQSTGVGVGVGSGKGVRVGLGLDRGVLVAGAGVGVAEAAVGVAVAVGSTSSAETGAISASDLAELWQAARMSQHKTSISFRLRGINCHLRGLVVSGPLYPTFKRLSYQKNNFQDKNKAVWKRHTPTWALFCALPTLH
jgi:hypothetical protein